MALYDAFISCSHAKDKTIASALQSAVQKLGKPWYQRRALRVFRDDTSLSATPSLWPSIERALGRAFLFQHDIQGWCPPIPILRRLGYRTGREID